MPLTIAVSQPWQDHTQRLDTALTEYYLDAFILNPVAGLYSLTNLPRTRVRLEE